MTLSCPQTGPPVICPSKEFPSTRASQVPTTTGPGPWVPVHSRWRGAALFEAPLLLLWAIVYLSRGPGQGQGCTVAAAASGSAVTLQALLKCLVPALLTGGSC